MRSRWWTAGAALTGLVVTVMAGVTPAAAQEGPYGSTTTTAAPPGPTVTCNVKGSGTVEPGATATVTIRHAPRGDQVGLFFDGEQVAEAEATGPGESPTVNFAMAFTVPEDTEPGPHQLVAVGTSFSATCQTRSGGTEVMSSSETRANGKSGAARLSSTRPLTGILVLLVVGIAVLFLSRAVVGAAARRRRAASSTGRTRTAAGR